MLTPTSEFCIWLSAVGIICTLVCLADCGKCPQEEGVCKHLNYDACIFFKSYNGLQNSCYSSNLSLDYHAGCQETPPLDDNVCLRSESGHFALTLCGFRSEVQCINSENKNDSGAALKTIKSVSNVSWPSDNVMFRFPNGRIVTCSSDSKEFDHVKLSPSVNSADQSVLSSCRGHLLYKKEISFSLWNTDLEKSQSSDSSPPHANICPSKLNSGQNYLYHSSVASLSLKNACNGSVLEVYEPLSTGSLFSPVNFSKVLLVPGEITSISFAYLPSALGMSSAELVLQTSSGGFLVDAKGFAVESPSRLRPLVGLDSSSGGWLSRKMSLLNPFNETIDLKEVIALLSVTGRTGSLLVESVCRKQNCEGSNKLSFSVVHKFSNGESGQLDHMSVAVRPLNNWLISPHRTQIILEIIFSLDSELNVIGAVCMKLSRPLEGEKSMLVIPFEAELKKSTNRKDTASSLSVSVEAVGPCDATETTISISAPRGIEADEFVREGWRAQNTMSKHYLLECHEVLFPLVLIGKYYAKSITVRNPSQHPVIVQLTLNSRDTVDNCKTCYGNQQSPSPSILICKDFTRVNMDGISVADNSITEVFQHPHGIASLCPILFHSSNRCEWKSSAFIRSNLCGLELLSLKGFGGSLCLVILEGLELVQRLDFNINLPFPLNKSNIKDTSCACCRLLSKKAFAVNAGDFLVKVERIAVSGRQLGLDLGLSYQSGFSVPVVRRELELNLGVGILVIPLQASIPVDTLNLCGMSINWRSVGTCLFILIIFVCMWFPIRSDSKIKGEEKSSSAVRPEAESSSILFQNQGNGKATTPTETYHSKQGLVEEHTDRSVDCRTAITPSSDGVKEINFSPSKLLSVDKLEVAQPVRLTVKTRNVKRRRSRKRNTLVEACSSQSGNATLSSPLSPVTTLSPPETCSPYQEDKMQPRVSYSPEPVVVSSARDPENQNHNWIATQQQSCPSGLKKTGSRGMLSPSATYPGLQNSVFGWEIPPDARAPGPKVQPQKPDEKRRAEDRFAYDIWGNHFSGLHLCKPNSSNKPNISLTIDSDDVGQSNSFFLRGPQQIFMTNPQPPYVSSFYDEG